jgi:hypothetical protein
MYWSTEVRSQKSEVRSQKSEVRSQRSEVRGQALVIFVTLCRRFSFLSSGDYLRKFLLFVGNRLVFLIVIDKTGLSLVPIPTA